MPVKFNDHSANERRRNAEVSYKDSLLRRKSDVNAGADGAQSAIIYKFPNLIAPKPLVAEMPASEIQKEIISQPIAPEATLSAGDNLSSEFIERRNRIIAAQQSVSEVHDEIPA